MIEQVFGQVIAWYMDHISYGSVILLMTIESSFIPFPSEIVVPPAAWKAAQGEMNVVLVALAGTAGSIFGALINYYLALFLGRRIVYKLADTKWAHMLLIDRKGVEKAERVFNNYGKSSTFFGRLIPAIRQTHFAASRFIEDEYPQLFVLYDTGLHVLEYCSCRTGLFSLFTEGVA